MSTTLDKVLSTPELLELILARLPMRNLLFNALLVSKTWHAIVILPSLQRTLFFQPDHLCFPPIQNPLLAEKFPPFFAALPRARWSSNQRGTAGAVIGNEWGGGVLRDPSFRMGDLYDIGLLRINNFSSEARIYWNNDVGAENDLIFDTISVMQCKSGGPRSRPLDQQFYSDGAKSLELMARIIRDKDA
ncbi:hypothetical protein DFH07DRAFT_963614 [Mycena maculata]|uniref:F-box domain-containing protein n=1 Tax=Mycena maculata TaxID=230809 RepID=A0AAD7IK85_9AGAR|nr:hypothetical protein DFH07DRAFT_963614 [Mycena maculata]